MAKILVANATALQAALTNAKAGDTIALAQGHYGDFKIKNVNFATEVKIVAADASKPPVFNTIDVITSKGIHFQNIVIDLKPTEATIQSTPALEIRGSTNISFSGGRIEGGDAISGVSKDALVLDKTENVIGMSTGQGVLVFESNDIVIEKTEITDLAKGIVLYRAEGVEISGNNIHDLRTSHIISAGSDNVDITGNRLSDSNPWRWGSGDHGDYIHLFTIKGDEQTKNINITGNVLDQGDGTAILGIYLDDNGFGVGYSNVNIANNLIINGNSQGIRLENVTQSRVVDNVMVPADTAQTAAPGILVKTGSSDVFIEGNYTGFVDVDASSQRIAAVDNFQIQNTDIHKSGYYLQSDILTIDGLSPEAALDYMSSVFKAWTETDFSTMSVDKTMTFSLASTTVGMKVTAKTNESAVVTGGGGDDTLTGRQGNDTIAGGDGKDMINGAGGNDLIFGGRGADTFNFDGNYPTSGGMDVIADFSRSEGDIIRLHSIDANVSNGSGTNEKFTFIGEATFSRTAGELRVEYKAGDAFVSGDVNGDGVADFAIRVVGGQSLLSTDFVL